MCCSALDCAASEFYKDGKYVLAGEGLTTDASARDGPTICAKLVDKYPIISIEDGMAEDDWDGWKMLHRRARQDEFSSSATTCS